MSAGTTTTRSHTATTGTHTATTGTHTTPSTRWLVGQCYTALLGSLLYLLVMLLSDLLSFLGGFCGTHFCVILSSFLLRHELAAVDLFVLVGRERESTKQSHVSIWGHALTGCCPNRFFALFMSLSYFTNV